MWSDIVSPNFPLDFQSRGFILQLAADAVVNVWKWYGGRNESQELSAVTAAGYKAITSACWYLNIISYGSDWQKYYNCDPQVIACCLLNVLQYLVWRFCMKSLMQKNVIL